jgi:hypothetical protein
MYYTDPRLSATHDAELSVVRYYTRRALVKRETTLSHVHHCSFLAPCFLEGNIYVTKYHQVVFTILHQNLTNNGSKKTLHTKMFKCLKTRAWTIVFHYFLSRRSLWNGISLTVAIFTIWYQVNVHHVVIKTNLTQQIHNHRGILVYVLAWAMDAKMNLFLASHIIFLSTDKKKFQVIILRSQSECLLKQFETTTSANNYRIVPRDTLTENLLLTTAYRSYSITAPLSVCF